MELPLSESVLIRALLQRPAHFSTVRMCHENVKSQLPINSHEQVNVLIVDHAFPYRNAAC